MASFKPEGNSGWNLQTKKRVQQPLQNPAAMSAELMSSVGSGGGFAGWTNVPYNNLDDPYISDQMRFGRRPLRGPVSDHAPEPFAGGKLCVGPHHSASLPEGKRAFPELVGSQSTNMGRPTGLKRVPTRARSDEPSLADPNTAVKHLKPPAPESVKMFGNVNQVNYSCWKPEELKKAEYGDWNWNQQLGFRRVNMTEGGEPRRGLENPVAWPGYVNYPPANSPITGKPLDYALSINGRHGGFTLKTRHPDIIKNTERRAALNTQITTMAASSGAQTGLYRKGVY